MAQIPLECFQKAVDTRKPFLGEKAKGIEDLVKDLKAKTKTRDQFWAEIRKLIGEDELRQVVSETKKSGNDRARAYIIAQLNSERGRSELRAGIESRRPLWGDAKTLSVLSAIFNVHASIDERWNRFVLLSGGDEPIHIYVFILERVQKALAKPAVQPAALALAPKPQPVPRPQPAPQPAQNVRAVVQPNQKLPAALPKPQAAARPQPAQVGKPNQNLPSAPKQGAAPSPQPILAQPQLDQNVPILEQLEVLRLQQQQLSLQVSALVLRFDSSAKRQLEGKEPEAKRRRNECTVCLDAEAAVVLVPCGHLCLCGGCSKDLKDCPVCRSQVDRIQPVFKA